VPVDAPEGTPAMTGAAPSSARFTAKVGRERESRISIALRELIRHVIALPSSPRATLSPSSLPPRDARRTSRTSS